MLYFDVCLVVRCAVCVCVGFLERVHECEESVLPPSM